MLQLQAGRFVFKLSAIDAFASRAVTLLEVAALALVATQSASGESGGRSASIVGSKSKQRAARTDTMGGRAHVSAIDHAYVH